MTESNLNVLLRYKGSAGGPTIFSDRLYHALSVQPGISVSNNSKSPHDVELCFISSPKKSKTPTILRVDGCYYTTKKLSANKPIVRSVKEANHVIFQSEFSRKMCFKILKYAVPSYSVIHNGIDLNYVDSISPDPSIIPGSFVCCAHWRESKRLKSIVNGFLTAGLNRHLYVIGPNEYYSIKHPKIHWLGSLKPQQSIAVMKSCAFLVHLCYIDSCPNTVIEALACNLPVLCTNLGGTPELVGKENGVILNADKWDFKPKKIFDVDTMNPSVVAAGMHSLVAGQYNIQRDRFDINQVCARYVKTIKSVYANVQK